MAKSGDEIRPTITIHGKPARWLDVPAVVRDKARQHRDKPFCEMDGHTLTYAELDRLSDAIATGLGRRGVRRGDCVASFMFNCHQQALGWIGANKLGAIWAPFNAGLGSDDLAHALSTIKARVLIVEPETAEKVARLPRDAVRDLLIFTTGPCELAAEPVANLLAADDKPPAVELAPSDPALILFTGGTTGLPKGVVLPHFALIGAAYRFGEVYRPSPDDHYFTTLPMFHGGGIILGTLGPLMSDITTTLDRRFSATEYWSRVKATGATLIDPIGTMMTVLCMAPEQPDDRKHKVRLSLGVSGQIPDWVPETFSKRFGIPIIDVYGLTEAGCALITSNRPETGKRGSVGRAHGWAEISIVDEFDAVQPAGSLGEIVLRPSVPFIFMLGYHGQPEATQKTMRNQWLHTGDLGRLDDAGNLYFAGREVHWLRRRGENISAYEIEDVISRHPDVVEAVVVGVPAEIGEEDVMAWVIPGSPRLTPESVVEFCMDKLAPFKIPRFVRFVDEFPRSTAKREIERNKLKAMGRAEAWDRESAMGRLSAQARHRDPA